MIFILTINNSLMTSEIIKETKNVLSYKKIHNEKSKIDGELFFELLESNKSLSMTNLYLLKIYLESINFLNILNEDNLVDIKYKNYLDEIESIIFCKENNLILDDQSMIWINQYKNIYNEYKSENTQILFDLNKNEFYVIELFEEKRDFYKPKTIIPLHDNIINIVNEYVPILNIHSVSKDNFSNYSTEYYIKNNRKPYSYHGEQKTITFNEFIEYIDFSLKSTTNLLDVQLIKEQKEKLLPYLSENKNKKILLIND